MKRWIGRRGMSAVMGFMVFASGTSAPAQSVGAADIRSAVQSVEAGSAAKPLGSTTSQSLTTNVSETKAPETKAVETKAVATITGSVIQAAPGQAVTVKLAPSIAREAAWLQSHGWPLYALVDKYSAGAPLDEQAQCVAIAVYHEARGESLEGQMAVARVIMNRAASGKYPSSWCGTVKQPWQFSFVNPRTGLYPAVDENSASWRKALGVTRLAVSNAVSTLTDDVLWYHADYVAPSWGRRLTRVNKIGTHIFYRA